MKTNDVVRFLFISPVIDDDYVLSWGYVSLEVISVYGLGKYGVNRFCCLYILLNFGYGAIQMLSLSKV
jgi:hypothetical protein